MKHEGPGRRWTRIFRPDARAEVEEELSFHFEQRVQENLARGMDAESARAAAQQRLGDLKPVQQECAELLTAERRAEKQREWLQFSLLDFKLGLRMLVKYPGLTVVGGLAMAFAIWVGAGTFELITQVIHPQLPLPGGDRIVAIENYDAKASNVERQALHDFISWRDELKTVEELGAYRAVQRNLAIASRVVEPLETVEISASAFRMAGVRPLMGRTLVASDEQPTASPVAVIGYDLWQQRFEGVADVVGQTVKLGSVQTTIIGVMPEGFAFPVAHSLWIPLRLNVLEYARRGGPGIAIFGRLASGASLEDAQAELTAIGKRAARDFPDTHEHLQPRIMPFAMSILDLSTGFSVLLFSSNLFLVMLLVLICANVALLMFARAATREDEITVRSALGASRGRIVGQLFAEALVLGAVAAVVGLVFARFGLRWVLSIVAVSEAERIQIPFWIHDSLSPMTILYAALLTLIGAAIAGVLPGLKVTRGLQTRLREAVTGSNLSFGGVWTVVIVAQVAVTVAFPFTAAMVRHDKVKVSEQNVGVADHEYLTARLELDRQLAPDAAARLPADEFNTRFRTSYLELERRLEADPMVSSVTFATLLPRMYHPHRLVELDAGGGAPLHPQWPDYRVSSASVDPGFFDALGVPIITGRGFRASDIGSDHRVIIVNQSFVQRVLGGRNPIGRRVRYTLFEDRSPRKAGEDEPWYEIIGVVRDLGMSVGQMDPKIAGFYHPAAPESAYPMRMAIHVKGDPAAFATRLRQIAGSVDPGLRLYNPMPLSAVSQGDVKFLAFWFNLTAIVSGVSLLLSLAGIYAVMAFTVARRKREIGIRVALGGSALPIVASILRRPTSQVALGIVMGTAIVVVLMGGVTGGDISIRQAVLVTAYALAMMVVCMLACIVPTSRVLRVQPVDVLKGDA
jgi:putative ABC transport system permease protein